MNEVEIVFSRKTDVSFYEDMKGKRKSFYECQVMPRELMVFRRVVFSTATELFIECLDGQLASVQLASVKAVNDKGW